MIIIVDTREKDLHILKKFDKLKIPYIRKKLDYGDYSFEIDGVSYEDKICIERKKSLDELAGNFTKGRDRFKREFERAMSKKCKVHLVVEDASLERIEMGDYRSRFSPLSFKNTLSTWGHKFQFTLDFIERKNMASYILLTFQKHIEEAKKL